MDDGEEKVGEMFCGVGGFRLGLERANGTLLEKLLPKSKSLQANRNCSEQPGKREDANLGSEQLQSQIGRGDVNQRALPNGDCSKPSGEGRVNPRKFRIVWANEWDKYACQIYRKNFGEKELVEGDIREVKTDDIPDIDFLCAGFPCQSFSLAGKRQGTGESRGTLFAQIVRVAHAKRPRILLLENVKGLLSSNLGRDFAIILRTLGNLGYILQWEVCNSKYYGVPQNRERVFIIGHFGTGSFRQIFPVGSHGKHLVQQVGENTEGQEIAWALRERDYKDGTNFVFQEHSFSGENGRGRGLRVYQDIVPTLSQQMGTGGNNVPMVEDKPKIIMTSHTQANIKQRIQERDTTWTLDATQSKMAISKEGTIRRLTPMECERLQGFPDRWTESVSDSQRYKLLGNAVTVNVIQHIGELLLDSFNLA